MEVHKPQKSIHAIAAFEEYACFHKKHIQTVRSDFPQTLLANKIGSDNIYTYTKKCCFTNEV